ncbi:MAG: class II fructose-bisphosphate aldolase, partial [Candidatus Colwellbacteria bacterium]|nr:class II fructose-bisphosphate aldolase [Candidatus Colwellbacteria bacterium]
MFSLRKIISDAEANKIAVGHFNISDITALKAIFRAASELQLPVIIGVSEGERNFIGVRLAAALVKSFREGYDYPIFLNADHTYSLDEVKKAVQAGYDSVIFDGAKLPIDENIKRTKEVVEYVKSVNPDIVVEGEIGYIGTSSMILDAIPAGAVISGEGLTSPAEAALFVKETGVDMLAPA